MVVKPIAVGDTSTDLRREMINYKFLPLDPEALKTKLHQITEQRGAVGGRYIGHDEQSVIKNGDGKPDVARDATIELYFEETSEVRLRHLSYDLGPW